MNDWKPITRQELDDLIAEQLAECSPEQAACFRKHRVEPHHAPLERYGKLEQVFVVAQRDDVVIYYEDVEDGFNLSPLGPDGRILQHWCNQDDLKHALWKWTND